MKANRTLIIACLISSTATMHAGKKSENIPSSKIAVFCAALFGSGVIVYQTYQYIWGHPEWDERVRRIDARVDKLVESSQHLESEVGIVKKKVDVVDQRVEAVQQGVNQVQGTQSEHGKQLKTLDDRTREITNHLLAIRKKQEEHSENLEGLRQQLVQFHETGASKSDIERCETAIKELMAKHYQSLTATFEQLTGTQKSDLQALKQELLQGNTQAFDALEQRLTKLVATESFIAQRCDQLKNELQQQIKETIREEFNHQRIQVGLDQRPRLIKQATSLKTTAS